MITNGLRRPVMLVVFSIYLFDLYKLIIMPQKQHTVISNITATDR